MSNIVNTMTFTKLKQLFVSTQANDTLGTVVLKSIAKENEKEKEELFFF